MPRSTGGCFGTDGVVFSLDALLNLRSKYSWIGLAGMGMGPKSTDILMSSRQSVTRAMNPHLASTIDFTYALQVDGVLRRMRARLPTCDHQICC